MKQIEKEYQNSLQFTEQEVRAFFKATWREFCEKFSFNAGRNGR